MTLYVGNLPYRVHEGEVKVLFGEFGPVNSVRLVRDRKTGRRKGFGFVEMSESGAQKAMVKLNDYNFQERTLKVREAKTQDSEGTERTGTDE
jgi:RNA recognition motif-containing protein